MIGNAVPVNLAYHIAMSIRTALDKHHVKYSQHDSEIISLCNKRFAQVKPTPNIQKSYKQLSFLDLYDQYALESITSNYMVNEDIHREQEDPSKSVLISLVKKDNEKMFIDGTATIYYTGKKFPTSVALNKLFYFMPYIKGKGVRDLFLIKKARLGYRKEGTPQEDKDDLRLVFEVEFVKQLFDEYKPVELNIWRTFTDTTLGEILNEKQ